MNVPKELSPELLERLKGEMTTDELLELVSSVVDGAGTEELFVIMRELVGAASEDQLELLVSNRVLRSHLLDEIMLRMAGQFRTDKAKGLDAVVHWKIFDRPGGGYDHYELVVEDGVCRLSQRPEHEPRVTFRIKPVAFLRLVTGHASGTRLAIRGRLQVVGDIAFAGKVNGLFQLPEG